MSNWRFSALNEYSTLVDYPWTPCLTCCIQYFMFDWVLVSEKRSVNHNSNLIKVVVFAQYWEVGLGWWFSIHWGNITTLMRFELWLTLLLSLVLIRTWNIGYNMLGRVSRDHQRAWNIHSVLKIINLTLSQYTIAITLILRLLKCVNFVRINVCSTHAWLDRLHYMHFHTWR